MGIELQIYLGPYIECPRDKRSPHRYDIVEDEVFDIETNDESKMFLAPNIVREGAPRQDIEWDNPQCLDLQDANPAAEMAWLREAFSVEIAALEKAYGKVTLRWGLCQWWA